MFDVIDPKILFVGDGGVGKTSILKAFSHENFPKEYNPTI